MTESKTELSNFTISKQKFRITQLNKLLIYYKEITETIREPFLILDEKLIVVSANPAFYKKFKVRKSDTKGKLIYHLGDKQWDIPGLRTLLDHILPEHRVMYNYKVTHDFPDLGTKTMLLNARQIDSKQLILLAIEDVTTQLRDKNEVKEATVTLLKQRDRLQELSDSKHDFISLASHQLRTPATAVKQYIGMLNEGYAGEMTIEQKRMLTIAYQSNQRQLEIIEDLLKIAKVDDGKVYLEKASCDVVQKVEAAISHQVGAYQSREQSIIFEKPTREMMVHIDGKLMMMVIENLLDNAGKYSMPGKTVYVNIDEDEECTAINIKDNGIGIRLKDRKKLFKKFSRIDSPLSVPAGGTGLGLYWVKKIIDLHGGSLEVISKIHKGSTFTVKIPSQTDLNHDLPK